MPGAIAQTEHFVGDSLVLRQFCRLGLDVARCKTRRTSRFSGSELVSVLVFGVLLTSWSDGRFDGH
jgi:hypothetical protein